MSAGTRTLIVSSRECGFFPTVAEALREAQPGDQIEIRAGFYREHLTLAKSVEILGGNEREDVIIQADGDQ